MCNLNTTFTSTCVLLCIITGKMVPLKIKSIASIKLNVASTLNDKGAKAYDFLVSPTHQFCADISLYFTTLKMLFTFGLTSGELKFPRRKKKKYYIILLT